MADPSPPPARPEPPAATPRWVKVSGGVALALAALFLLLHLLGGGFGRHAP